MAAWQKLLTCCLSLSLQISTFGKLPRCLLDSQCSPSCKSRVKSLNDLCMAWLPRHLVAKFTSEFAQVRGHQAKSWLATGQGWSSCLSLPAHVGLFSRHYAKYTAPDAPAPQLPGSQPQTDGIIFFISLIFCPPTTDRFSPSVLKSDLPWRSCMVTETPRT